MTPIQIDTNLIKSKGLQIPIQTVHSVIARGYHFFHQIDYTVNRGSSDDKIILRLIDAHYDDPTWKSGDIIQIAGTVKNTHSVLGNQNHYHLHTILIQLD